MNSLFKKITGFVAVAALISIGLMASYGYAMFGSSMSVMMGDWRIDTAILLFVGALFLLHAGWVYVICRPLDVSERDVAIPTERAIELVERALWAPFAASVPTLFSYPIALSFSLGVINRFDYQTPALHWVFLIAASILMGILVAVLERNIFRLFAHGAVEQILMRHPDLVESRLPTRARGINLSLFTAFSTVLCVPMGLLFLLSVVRMQSLYAIETAHAKYTELRNIAMLVKEQAYMGGEEGVKDYLRQLTWERTTRLDLLDDQGRAIYTNEKPVKLNAQAMDLIRRPDGRRGAHSAHLSLRP